MTAISALIIEDNSFVATVLSDLLSERHPDVKLLGIATNGAEGIHMIRAYRPDLVFLDVELPDMTGFEMLQRLDKVDFQTIFTTAHSHYAIKAFRFNALDYLVKPVVADELAEAMARFKASYPIRHNEDKVQQALENLNTKNLADQKLVLQSQKGLLKFALGQILCIEGDRNYSYIHLSNGQKELLSKTLSYFEDILVDKDFFRCHRSYLVNRHQIEQLNGESFVLKNNISIPISRRKRGEAKTWFYQ